MPCEIKELVVNTTINEESNSNSISGSPGNGEQLNEAYLIDLINREISRAKSKIINDCIDHFNENNRLISQR
jgi:hypothetical protein